MAGAGTVAPEAVPQLGFKSSCPDLAGAYSVFRAVEQTAVLGVQRNSFRRTKLADSLRLECFVAGAVLWAFRLSQTRMSFSQFA